MSIHDTGKLSKIDMMSLVFEIWSRPPQALDQWGVGGSQGAEADIQVEGKSGGPTSISSYLLCPSDREQVISVIEMLRKTYLSKDVGK